MSSAYRIFGSELSPYSVKVRSYFRYKGIGHQWLLRQGSHAEEFQRLAKLPLIPLVVTPEGAVLQDSTPIIEKLEAQHPSPALQPEDPGLAFLSALLEEYGDEWGNKHMFHYRWFREADQISCAERLAAELTAGAPPETQAGAAAMIRKRMVPRLSFVGSSAETQAPIEDSYRRLLELLEAHLASRSFLFGGRPALADLGVFAQLYEASTDPTAGGLLREQAPRVLDWVERMLEPRAEGDFESWESLATTLLPLLREEVGAAFLPWSVANARALAAGEKSFSLEIGAAPFSQDTQKYHAKSLGVLRQKYAAVPDRAKLDAILSEVGCAQYLA